MSDQWREHLDRLREESGERTYFRTYTDAEDGMEGFIDLQTGVGVVTFALGPQGPGSPNWPFDTAAEKAEAREIERKERDYQAWLRRWEGS